MSEDVKENQDMQTQQNPTTPMPQPKRKEPTVVVQADLPASLVKRMDEARVKGGKLTRKAILQWGVEAWVLEQEKRFRK